MSLAPDISIANIDTRAVVLDAVADRYRLIVGSKAAALRRLAQGASVDDAAALDALVQERILVSPVNATIRTAHNLAPQRSATEMAARSCAALSLVSVGRTLVGVALRQKLVGFAATVRWARILRQNLPTPESIDIVAFAQAFDSARALLPVERVCLRDSLALYTMLLRHGMVCNLVFGVRLDPFGAHCWVQSGDIILSDTVWSARPMQPILVL